MSVRLVVAAVCTHVERFHPYQHLGDVAAAAAAGTTIATITKSGQWHANSGQRTHGAPPLHQSADEKFFIKTINFT